MKTNFWLARIYFLFGFAAYVASGAYLGSLDLPPHCDPLLELIPVVDVSASLYGLILIYVAAFVCLKPLFKSEKETEFWVIFGSMLILRAIMCVIANFGPPVGYFIADKEIWIHAILQKLHLLFRADFFFSGHTAAPFFFFLFFEGKAAKTIFLTGTIAMAVSVLLLHHHYVIDVVAAPVIVWAVYSFFKFLVFGGRGK